MAKIKKPTKALQENILSILLHNDKQGRIVAGMVDPELFEGDYGVLAERAVDYWQRYDKAPSSQAGDIVADIIDKGDARSRLFTEILRSTVELADQVNEVYVLDQLSAFVRFQKIKRAIMQSAEHINAQAELSVEDIETIWTELLRQRDEIVFDRGLSLADYSEVLDSLESQQLEFPTGIKEFDKAHIGPARGTVLLLLGPSGKGKCIVENEPVLLADGSYVPINEMPATSWVPAWDGNKFVTAQAHLKTSGKQPAFLVRLRSGREVRLTGGHRLLSSKGWQPLAELTVDDQIAMPANLPVFGNQSISAETARVLGYLIADGGLTKSTTPTFTKNDPVIVADMRRCLASFNTELAEDSSRLGNYWVVNNVQHCYKASQITKLLTDTNLLGKKSNAKHVPDIIFHAPRAIVGEFLKALFSCDGSVYRNKQSYAFSYSTTSYLLARHVDNLLCRFGIVATIQHKRSVVSGRNYQSWNLIVRNRDQLKLLHNEIGLLSTKADKLGNAIMQPLERSMQRDRFADSHVGDLVFDSIVSIEPIGVKNTYDLMVEQSHNFICGNILVHNSWFCVHLGKKALIQGKRVLHITLEMSQKQVAQRYYQSLFNASKRDAISKAPIIRYEDEVNKTGPIGIDFITVNSEFILRGLYARDELETRLNVLGARAIDNLIIKSFPSLSMQSFTNYLDNLQNHDNWVPDLVILDYWGLIDPKTGADEYRLGMGRAFKMFRSVMVERNMAGVTPNQVNRKGMDATSNRMTDATEDISIAYTADVVLNYSSTDREQRAGVGRLYVSKGRDERDKFGVFLIQHYETGQFCLESHKIPANYNQMIDNLPRERDDDESNEDKA